jgi:hypothetical protein
MTEAFYKGDLRATVVIHVAVLDAEGYGLTEDEAKQNALDEVRRDLSSGWHQGLPPHPVVIDSNVTEIRHVDPAEVEAATEYFLEAAREQMP